MKQKIINCEKCENKINDFVGYKCKLLRQTLWWASTEGMKKDCPLLKKQNDEDLLKALNLPEETLNGETFSIGALFWEYDKERIRLFKEAIRNIFMKAIIKESELKNGK